MLKIKNQIKILGCLNKMNIDIVHYSFENDGVTSVVLNNIRGLRKLYQNINFNLIGETFSPKLPKDINKTHIDFSSLSLLDELESVTKNSDVVVIENPTVGVNPLATMAYKEFTEINNDKKVIYRTHDFLGDRPDLFDKFKRIAGTMDVQDIYPLSDNVKFLTLTTNDKKRLDSYGLSDVSVLQNSVVSSDFSYDKERGEKLRKVFEDKGIISRSQLLLSYPVRMIKRKNVEEALLLTKMLNNQGYPYKLVVTLPADAKNKGYQESLEQIAEDFNIPCSLGKAYESIGFDKNKGFTVSDLFSSSLVVSTSVQEGFGYVFVEPWLSGAAFFGRNISNVTEDFKARGINLGHQYSDKEFKVSEDSDERVNNVREILSNPEYLEKLNLLLDIDSRIKQAQDCVEQNCKVVKENYDYIPVAQKFARFLRE